MRGVQIKLSPEALQECKEAFVLYDVDGSGAVDEGELFCARPYPGKPSSQIAGLRKAGRCGRGVAFSELTRGGRCDGWQWR